MVHEFTLTDASGQPHEYSVTPHGASKGTGLCMRVLKIAGEPVGRLASANLGQLLDMVGGIEVGDGASNDEVFASIKDRLSELDVDFGDVIRDVQMAISELGDEKLFAELFHHSYRDGKPLANPAVYDEAYQANYMELFRAIWEVVTINGFLPLLRIL